VRRFGLRRCGAPAPDPACRARFAGVPQRGTAALGAEISLMLGPESGRGFITDRVEVKDLTTRMPGEFSALSPRRAP
jgi:hypothetical protein